MMHRLGYDVKELPSVHLGEQRRLLEGQFMLDELEQDREMAKLGGDPQKARMEQASNDRALQQFKESKGLN
jgi:hypothetical protein